MSANLKYIFASFSVQNFTQHFVFKYKAISLWNNKNSIMFLYNTFVLRVQFYQIFMATIKQALPL